MTSPFLPCSCAWQRGTVVERLQEVVVTSSEHLRQLLAECEGE